MQVIVLLAHGAGARGTRRCTRNCCNEAATGQFLRGYGWRRPADYSAVGGVSEAALDGLSLIGLVTGLKGRQ